MWTYEEVKINDEIVRYDVYWIKDDKKLWLTSLVVNDYVSIILTKQHAETLIERLNRKRRLPEEFGLGRVEGE